MSGHVQLVPLACLNQERVAPTTVLVIRTFVIPIGCQSDAITLRPRCVWDQKLFPIIQIDNDKWSSVGRIDPDDTNSISTAPCELTTRLTCLATMCLEGGMS